MLKTIPSRLAAAFGLILLIELLLLGFTLTRHLGEETAELSVVNHQIALVELITKNVALLHAGSLEEAPVRLTGQREEIDRATQVFEQSQAAVEEGGEAATDLAATRLHKVPVPSADVRRLATRAAEQWGPYRRAVADSLRSGPSSLPALLAAESSLVAALEATSAAVEEELEANQGRLVLFEYLAVGLTLIAIFVALAFARRSISEPILNLANRAEALGLGDVEGVVPRSGPVEIQTLATALERLRISVKKLIEAAS